MATTLYPVDIVSADTPDAAYGVTLTLQLITTRGSAANSAGANTVNGPTSGVPMSKIWFSPVLAADVTISGTITANLRMDESSMSANAGADILVERCDAVGSVISTIARSEKGTELGTSEAAQNWTMTPTSTACRKGDRIKVTVFANDAATMASGYIVNFYYNGPTAGASGDSYITFTETLDFSAIPTPVTKLYVRDDAADIDLTADVDKGLALTAGAGTVTKATNTVAGPTAGVQVTNTAGGTVVLWWSKPLNAITIAVNALITCNLYGFESSSSGNTCWRIKVEKTSGDGTNPVLITDGTWADELNAPSTSLRKFYLQPASAINIASGERIKVTLYGNDAGGNGNMGSGITFTLAYDGTDSYDTWLGFEQTITELSGITILPNAISSSEVLGTLTLIHGNINIQSTAITSSEDFGSPTLPIPPSFISPVSINSGEIFGASVLVHGIISIPPSTIATSEVVGTPSLILANINIQPSTILSDEVIGSHISKAIATISPTAVVSGEISGTTTLTLGLINILPTAITSSEVIGSHTLLAPAQTIEPVAINSAEVFGSPRFDPLWPISISSDEQLGSPTLVAGPGIQTILPSVIVSNETIGVHTLIPGLIIIQPTEITSAESVGTPVLKSTNIISTIAIDGQEVVSQLILRPESIISPTTIDSQEVFVALLVIPGPTEILPGAVTSAEILGNPVLQTGGVRISPVEISSSELFELPSLIASTTIITEGIAPAETLNSPVLVPGISTIIVSGISSGEIFGTITIPNVLAGWGWVSAKGFGRTRVAIGGETRDSFGRTRRNEDEGGR